MAKIRNFIEIAPNLPFTEYVFYEEYRGAFEKTELGRMNVSSGSRRQGIGRALVEHIIDFARRELTPVDLHLTSRPERVAANEMYGKLGFERRGTDVYRMMIQTDK